MGRKRINDKKVALNLSIRESVIKDYKKFVKEKGEKVSPRVEKLIKKDMENK